MNVTITPTIASNMMPPVHMLLHWVPSVFRDATRGGRASTATTDSEIGRKCNDDEGLEAAEVGGEALTRHSAISAEVCIKQGICCPPVKIASDDEASEFTIRCEEPANSSIQRNSSKNDRKFGVNVPGSSQQINYKSRFHKCYKMFGTRADLDNASTS